jgi:hypothetical protein
MRNDTFEKRMCVKNKAMRVNARSRIEKATDCIVV